MANLDLLIKAWDEAIWEFTLVFEGLGDDDVWRRPHPKLLSVGELTGHLAYYEALYTTDPAVTSEENIPEQLAIKSPLIDSAFSYYTNEVDKPVSLGLSANEVLAEFKRIHDEARANAVSVSRDSDDKIEGGGRTWGFQIQYLGFHAAYHAGQAYSVRHLMGHETTDN